TAGDLTETLAERADRYGQHTVTGRKRIHDHGLQRAGARGRVKDDVVGRFEHEFQAIAAIAKQASELRTAMVDHRSGHLAQHLFGHWRGAWNTKIQRHGGSTPELRIRDSGSRGHPLSIAERSIVSRRAANSEL